MKYDFNEQALLHFHALELLETSETFRMATDRDTAISFILEKLTNNTWEEDIIKYLKYTFHSPDDIHYRKIAYYLASGCGIMRIIALLGTNQYQVYKVRDSMVETMNNLPDNAITLMFKQYPEYIERLQEYMALFNVLDGFRILSPSTKGIYLQGQVKGK